MSKEDRKARQAERREKRKPFKDSGLGIFLKDKLPAALDIVGDLLPDKGVLGIVKNLVSKDDTLSPEDKAHALDLIEADLKEMEEISERWKADMASDSWLSKNIRPMVCGYTWILLTVVFCLKWAGYDLPDTYVTLFTTLALAVNAAYFGARTIEKYHKKKY